jgi:hypothetical protein
MFPVSSRRERAIVDARRRCLVCDWEEILTEPEETDVLGPPCTRCRAPTERIAVANRRFVSVTRNPHAAALGRLGGLRGGPARAAALSARRRRDIARMAALARWKNARRDD